MLPRREKNENIRNVGIGELSRVHKMTLTLLLYFSSEHSFRSKIWRDETEINERG